MQNQSEALRKSRESLRFLFHPRRLWQLERRDLLPKGYERSAGPGVVRQGAALRDTMTPLSLRGSEERSQSCDKRWSTSRPKNRGSGGPSLAARVAHGMIQWTR